MTKIGVLALQGGFSEHVKSLQKCGAEACEIRTEEELKAVDALVIPGGESTTLGLIATRCGMIDPLKEHVASGKPTWGTCAGLIVLANSVTSQASFSQSLIGGIEINAERNAFGRQQESYETKLDLHDIGEGPDLKYENKIPMVFIRAPCITKILDQDKVKVLATLPNTEPDSMKRIVAVRQSQMLATSFHPELTEDLSWHQYFIDMIAHYAK